MNQLLLMLEIIGAVVVIYFLTPIIIALFLGAFCPLYQIVEKIYNYMAGLLYPWRWYKQNQKRNATKGEDLLPIFYSIAMWGLKYIP